MVAIYKGCVTFFWYYSKTLKHIGIKDNPEIIVPFCLWLSVAKMEMDCILAKMG